MWFDSVTFLQLVEKNERKFFSGKSIKDIREAMEFFQSPSNRSRLGIAYSEGKLAKERISRALEAMGLSLSFELPKDPVLKNKIWNEQVKPMQKVLREIFQHEKL